MPTPEDKTLEQTALLSPIIAASLLNAVYSYLAWRKPLDYDDKTFAEAFEIVKKDWISISQQLLGVISDHLNPNQT
jgi:hypothetical protein